MGGQDATVTMQQGEAGPADLARSSLAAHLAGRLDQMSHGAPDAAVAIAQKTAVGVEGQVAVGVEMPRRRIGPRLAAGG